VPLFHRFSGAVNEYDDQSPVSSLKLIVDCYNSLTNRAPSAQRRKVFVKLTEDVKSYGGEVLIFSSMHESGQREWLSLFLSPLPAVSCESRVILTSRKPVWLTLFCSR